MFYWKVEAMPGLFVKKICERFRSNRFHEIDYSKVHKTIASQNLKIVEHIRAGISRICHGAFLEDS